MRQHVRLREHLISAQFFSKRNAFQIGFTPLPPPSIRKAYRTFSDNNRCRLSSRPRLSTTKLLRASLLSFSSREASADNIISTSSSFSPFPVSLHASSALRLASTRGRPGLQARIYKLLITVGWRTVWTRFSDYRFSKKVQLSRHLGPHRTKRKFSHAIFLCLVRVRKVPVHCNSKSTAVMSSCTLALGRLATAPARSGRVHERDELVGPRPALPMPRGALRRLDRPAYGRSPRLVDLPGFEQ